MAIYRFQVKKHIRDDMYQNESIEIELSDSEYNSIKSDDNNYSKGSSFLTSKLGKKVKSMGFPTEIKSSKMSTLLSTKLGESVKSVGSMKEKESSKKKSKEDEKSQSKKSSLWRPLWAMPFKLIWRIIT